MRDRLPPLPERENAHAGRTAEQPQDPDRHPAGEEALAEDIPGAIHGHGPEDEQDERHGHGQGAGDDGGFLQFALLGGVGVDGGGATVVDVGDEFEVNVCGLGNVRVVANADERHGDPVVVLAAGRVGQDGDEDERGQEGGDVAGQHGVVAPRTVDGQGAAGLLRRHEPCDHGDDEAEHRRQRRRDPVLLFPQQRQGRGEDGRGDDHAHEEVEPAHADAGVEEAS